MAINDSGILWREFAAEFIQEMINAATSRSGRSWRASPIHAHSSEAPNDLLWIRLSFSGSLQGDCALGISVENAGIVAADIKREDATGEAQILVESFASIASPLCDAAQSSYGKFTFAVSHGDGAGADCVQELALDFRDERGRSITMVIWASAELIGSLGSSTSGEKGDEPDASSETGASVTASLFGDAANLDLLMDVELDVTLRFGQRHLTLREVMDLSSGAVVELDRQIEEPVELILDGRVIARGDAVVIDGNYGLRVTDVPQPLTARQVRL